MNRDFYSARSTRRRDGWRSFLKVCHQRLKRLYCPTQGWKRRIHQSACQRVICQSGPNLRQRALATAITEINAVTCDKAHARASVSKLGCVGNSQPSTNFTRSGKYRLQVFVTPPPRFRTFHGNVRPDSAWLHCVVRGAIAYCNSSDGFLSDFRIRSGSTCPLGDSN